MPSTTCHFIRPAEYTIAFPTERQARHLERESEARYGRDGGVILRAGSVLVWIEPVRENLPAL